MAQEDVERILVMSCFEVLTLYSECQSELCLSFAGICTRGCGELPGSELTGSMLVQEHVALRAAEAKKGKRGDAGTGACPTSLPANISSVIKATQFCETSSLGTKSQVSRRGTYS